jgi:hypothetical protein
VRPRTRMVCPDCGLPVTRRGVGLVHPVGVIEVNENPLDKTGVRPRLTPRRRLGNQQKAPR